MRRSWLLLRQCMKPNTDSPVTPTATNKPNTIKSMSSILREASRSSLFISTSLLDDEDFYDYFPVVVIIIGDGGLVPAALARERVLSRRSKRKAIRSRSKRGPLFQLSLREA